MCLDELDCTCFDLRQQHGGIKEREIFEIKITNSNHDNVVRILCILTYCMLVFIYLLTLNMLPLVPSQTEPAYFARESRTLLQKGAMPFQYKLSNEREEEYHVTSSQYDSSVVTKIYFSLSPSLHPYQIT